VERVSPLFRLLLTRALRRSVAINGDNAVIGEPGAWFDTGRAHVFERIGSWIPQAVLVASDDAPGDHFGWSVAVRGTQIVVGAPLDDIVIRETVVANAGSAYVFKGTGNFLWERGSPLLPQRPWS